MASSEARRPIGFEDRLLAEAVRACEETRGATVDDQAANALARAEQDGQTGQLSAWGENARRMAQESFSWDHIAERVRGELYELEQTGGGLDPKLRCTQRDEAERRRSA